MKFRLEETLRGAPDEIILDDLRRVAKVLGKSTVTHSEYQQYGKCSSGTIIRRFGSWNTGLERAGLKISVQKDISDEELFNNLERMWVQLAALGVRSCIDTSRRTTDPILGVLTQPTDGLR